MVVKAKKQRARHAFLGAVVMLEETNEGPENISYEGIQENLVLCSK